MVEVLDHYHGPARRKLWLLAFAESASDSTRTGWCPRWKLAHRAGVSPEHATRVAGQLAREGVIKRHGGGHRGQAAVYELLPLAERVPPGTPIGTEKGATRGTHSGGKRVPKPGGKGDRTNGKGATTATPSLISLNTPHLLARGRGPADIIRAAYADATDDEIKFITEDRISHGARNLAAVLTHEAREHTLRLPCDRDGPDRHSNACRDGDPSECGMDWCTCRCHTEPAGPREPGTTTPEGGNP